MQKRQVAREISYAASARTRAGRTLIRTVENLTGRPGLIRRARGYELEMGAGADFWSVMMARYGLGLDVLGGSLDAIPREGPLVVVANHPFGILDGLVLGHVLSVARGEFRVVAHQVFGKAAELERVILPISFDGTKEGQKLNLATRAEALGYLRGGGCVGIFPGGTVSTALTPKGRPLDPRWRTFTAKMIAKSGATVVPVYFHGANSRRFQRASHLHYTLRMALLISEFKARVGAKVPLVVGDPIPPEEIAARAGDARALMDWLRARTYALSPEPVAEAGYGYEFEG
ncbi:lysophospholipid acyltransferase family protein [Roseobacter sp. HKCCA0434]|uniref:lysophospholipid acyltransferase family protein n=1 Tax=Roseobacter sp. HKCCA0434 TaxID=3079297 RepID=UPI002905A35A|nr:lysophospholipid acyltransferase family protein [Roseobacter sp. HKCCA0434]